MVYWTLRRGRSELTSSSDQSVNEFDLIEKYLSPLAGEGALGLKDDVAQHGGMVFTKDLLIDGVHFRTEDSWQAAAQKSVRANVSDIVAKGASPKGVMLGVVWPYEVTEGQIQAFMTGLTDDLCRYGLSLLGGDTTRHGKVGMPLTVSITMTGIPGARGPVLRSGATVGDVLFVTGTVGNGWLGLQAAEKNWPDYPAATETYLRPTPPVALRSLIDQFATASIDISDGLIADARHLAKASNVTLEIEIGSVPLSVEAQHYLSNGGDVALLLTGGDDYQVLMSVNTSNTDEFCSLAAAENVRLTRIGQVIGGKGSVSVLNKKGETVTLDRSGFSHF